MKKYDLQILLDLVDKFSGPLRSGPMKQLAALHRQTEVVDRSMDRLFTGGAILGGATAFAAPFIVGTAKAIEFETAMADVKRVVDLPTPRIFKEMSTDLLGLSLRIPLAADELAQLVEAAGQSKLYKTRTELLRFAEDSGKMATAFKMSAADAGGAMTGFRTIFRLTQDEVVSLGDAYNYLGNNMDARASDIVNIANRTGATAKLFGLTGQQAGALGASFLALKTPPEVAATGINALLNRLATAPQQTERFQGGLAKIGLEATDLKRRIGTDAQGALLDFLQRVRGSGDALGILTDLFGAEYADDVAKLVGSLDVYQNAVGLVGDKSRYAGSMQAEYLTQSVTTKNALILLRNNFNALGITIGTFYLPVIQMASRLMGGLIGPILRLANANPVVARTLAFVTAGLILMTAALGVGIIVNAGFQLGLAQTRLGLAAVTSWFGSARAAMLLYATGGVPTAAQMQLMGTRAGQLSLMLQGVRNRFVGATVASRAFFTSLLTSVQLRIAAVRALGLSGVLGIVQVGFMAATRAVWAFTASLLTNPVFLVIAAIVALGASFTWAWRKSDEFRAGIMRGLEPIRRSWGYLKNDVAALGQLFAPLGAIFGRVMGAMGLDLSKLQRPLDALAYGFGYFLGFAGTATAIVFGRIISTLTTQFGGLVQIVTGLVKMAKGLVTLDFSLIREGAGDAVGGLAQILLSPLELAGIDSRQFRKDLFGADGLVRSWRGRIGGWIGAPFRAVNARLKPLSDSLDAASETTQGWGAAHRRWIGERFQTGRVNAANLIGSLAGARDEGRPIWRSLLDAVTAPFSLPGADRRASFMPGLEDAGTAGRNIWGRITRGFPTFNLPWIKQVNFTGSLADAEGRGRPIWQRAVDFLTAPFSLARARRLSFDTSLADAEASGNTIWGRATGFLKTAVRIPDLNFSSVESSLNTMLDTITGFGPQMLEAGKALIGSLIEGFNERVGELTGFLDKLKFPWQRDTTGGGGSGGGRAGEAIDKATAPTRAVQGTSTYDPLRPFVPLVDFDLTKTLRNANVDPMSEYGRLLVRGFERGVLSEKEVAINAVRRMGADAEAGLRQQLQMRSSSRVFMGLGGFIPQGLGQGIIGQRSAVTQAMRVLAAAAVAVPIAPEVGAPELAARYSVGKLPAPPRPARQPQSSPDGTQGAGGGAVGTTVHKTYSFSGANFNFDMAGVEDGMGFIKDFKGLLESIGSDDE